MGGKWAGLWCRITCGARQRAATAVSLHELMERGGRGSRREEGGGREGVGGEGEEEERLGEGG